MAREGAEIANEVCLIEVPAVCRDLCPTYRSPSLDLSKNRSESLNPTEDVGRESNAFAKELDEPRMAQTHLGLHRRDRTRSRPVHEFVNPVLNAGVQRSRPGKCSCEIDFEDLE